MAGANVEPLETFTVHWPLALLRPATSAKPSPLKSASLTAVQLMPADQASQKRVLKALKPLDNPAYHAPVSLVRPMMSARPSLLRSPMRTSTQVKPGDQMSQRDVTKLVPVE